VVDWAMATRLRADLALDALEMAIYQRRAQGVIYHSAKSSHYTWLAFGKRCRETAVSPSMSLVGDAYDNALCESYFAILDGELLHRHRLRSR